MVDTSARLAALAAVTTFLVGATDSKPRIQIGFDCSAGIELPEGKARAVTWLDRKGTSFAEVAQWSISSRNNEKPHILVRWGGSPEKKIDWSDASFMIDRSYLADPRENRKLSIELRGDRPSKAGNSIASNQRISRGVRLYSNLRQAGALIDRSKEISIIIREDGRVIETFKYSRHALTVPLAKMKGLLATSRQYASDPTKKDCVDYSKPRPVVM